ncbi:hypothetical protein F4212_14125 [Candidatus Poribacteria bacterium]|nr:hypothetical protein [Candidatus Poribacteria bacterium]
MKQHSHLITMVGGILSVFCFALPWEDDKSGAILANSGQGTLITILFIFGLTMICISFSLLNRYTEWHLLSKIAALIITGLTIIFFSIIVDIFTGFSLFPPMWRSNHIFSFLNRIVGISLLFLLALAIIGFCVYVANLQLYQMSWRKIIALGISGVGILFCFALSFAINETEINLFIFSFIAAFTITGVSIYRLFRQSPWKSGSTYIVLLSSGIGICIFLILFLGRSLNLKIDGNLLYNPQYGAFLTAVGYLLAIIGVLSCIETTESKETQAIPEEETTTE